VLETLKAAGQKPNRMVRAYLRRHVKGHARPVGCVLLNLDLPHA
jgi:hypothetical protein